MNNLACLEAHFWSKVWRCHHGDRYTKCCWPWLQGDGVYFFDDIHQMFTDPRLLAGPISAHRFAMFLQTRMPVLHGKTFPVCHKCDWPPCCNHHHLAIGSPSDNRKDVSALRINRQRKAVRLPDGRLLTADLGALYGPRRISEHPYYSRRTHPRYLHPFPFTQLLHHNDYELRPYLPEKSLYFRTVVTQMPRTSLFDVNHPYRWGWTIPALTPLLKLFARTLIIAEEQVSHAN